MAAETPGQSESMEDILQSIKRIIEDDDAPAAATDVLELTQPLNEDGTPAQVAAPEPAPEPTVAETKKTVEEVFHDHTHLPETMAQPAPRSAPKPIAMEDGLVSEQAASAAAAALKPIAESANKDYSIPRFPSPELRSGNTIEDLVLESLRPMMKAWLEEHLPTIVHKIVEKEVRRIVTFHQN